MRQPVSDHTQNYAILLESLPSPLLVNDQILPTFSIIHIPRNSTLILTSFDKISLRLNLIKIRLEKGHLNRRQYLSTKRYSLYFMYMAQKQTMELQFFAQCDVVNELLIP